MKSGRAALKRPVCVYIGIFICIGTFICVGIYIYVRTVEDCRSGMTSATRKDESIVVIDAPGKGRHILIRT